MRQTKVSTGRVEEIYALIEQDVELGEYALEKVQKALGVILPEDLDELGYHDQGAEQVLLKLGGLAWEVAEREARNETKFSDTEVKIRLRVAADELGRRYSNGQILS